MRFSQIELILDKNGEDRVELLQFVLQSLVAKTKIFGLA